MATFEVDQRQRCGYAPSSVPQYEQNQNRDVAFPRSDSFNDSLASTADGADCGREWLMIQRYRFPVWLGQFSKQEADNSNAKQTTNVVFKPN